MTVRNFGRQEAGALVLAAAMLAAGAPVAAQDTTTSRPIDFRLPPPTNDGRAPGVQGPSDNGLPPVAPGERRGQPTPTPTPAPTPPPPPPLAPPPRPPTPPAPPTPPPPPPPRRPPPTAPPPPAPPDAPAAAQGGRAGERVARARSYWVRRELQQ